MTFNIYHFIINGIFLCTEKHKVPLMVNIIHHGLDAKSITTNNGNFTYFKNPLMGSSIFS
jgi:hypothetical protein